MALIVGVAIPLAFASLAGPPLQAQERIRLQAKSPKLEKLLEERLDTVREMVRLVSELFKNGQGTVEQMREANRMLFDAELEACASDKERLTLLENVVTEARKLEELAQAQSKAGQLPANRWLAVKADRLQAEITLERARAKPAAQPRGDAKPGPDIEDQVALAEKQLAIKRAAVKVAEVKVQIAVAKLSAVKAQVEGAKAAEAYAELQVKRMMALAGANAVSAEEVDAHRAKLEAAKADRAALQGKLAEREAHVELERTRVDVARLEADDAELRLKQLKAKLKPPQPDR
jgi:hypothetical protein